MTTCTASVAKAQSSTATLRGVVRDTTGGVLAAASITVTSLDTGRRRAIPTSADGSFQIVALPPGRYRIAVIRDGFSRVERDIDLALDEVQWQPFTLQVAGPSDRVTVTAVDRPLVDGSKTALGRTIATSEIEQLPILAGVTREFNALALLTPGISLDVGNAGGLSASGNGVGDNTTLVDGLSVDGVGIVVPLDAVSEFRAVSSQYTAEFGQAVGAVLDVLTRSGTNRAVGRAFVFQQNSSWSAASAAAALVGAADADDRQTTSGGFWGGPLLRNRAFLFVAAEQTVKRTSYVNTSPVARLFRPDDPVVVPNEVRLPSLFVRSDLDLTPSNILTIRYAYSRTSNDQAAREALSVIERRRILVNPIHSAGVSDTQTIGRGAVNELRVQWMRYRFEWSVDDRCPACATFNYPSIRLGKPANAPQVSGVTRADIADVLTWVTAGSGGRHSIKIGVGVSVVTDSLNRTPNQIGTYTFNRDLPFDPSNGDTYPTLFTQAIGEILPARHETIVSTFAQDEWQLRGGVTINAGVRWDHTRWVAPFPVRNDVAPRLGLAVDPWKTGVTIFRGGLGRYYNESLLITAREPEANLGQMTISRPGYQGDPTRFDPLGPNPARAGAAERQFSIYRFGRQATPYADQISAGMQRLIASSIGVSIDVVRARNHRLPIQLDLNYPDRVTGVRPDPDKTLKQIIAVETRADGWYTGLLVEMRTRPMRGQTYSVAYTWSVAENNTDGARSFPMDQTNLMADRGPTSNDARHRTAITASWTLPLGLHLATMMTARSSLPYNRTTGTDTNRDGVPSNDRPEGVGRNSERGSAFFQADMRLIKSFPIAARQIQIIVEAANVTNRANWLDYNGNTLGAFGKPASAGPPRRLLFGGRFNF